MGWGRFKFSQLLAGKGAASGFRMTIENEISVASASRHRKKAVECPAGQWRPQAKRSLIRAFGSSPHTATDTATWWFEKAIAGNAVLSLAGKCARAKKALVPRHQSLCCAIS